jgi:hypothetical protein
LSIDEDFLKEVGKLPNIPVKNVVFHVSLNTENFSIDDFLMVLEHFKASITSLELERAHFSSIKRLQAVVKMAPNLERLKIIDCTFGHNNDTTHLHLPKVKSLTLSENSCDIWPKLLKSLTPNASIEEFHFKAFLRDYDSFDDFYNFVKPLANLKILTAPEMLVQRAEPLLKLKTLTVDRLDWKPRPGIAEEIHISYLPDGDDGDGPAVLRHISFDMNLKNLYWGDNPSKKIPLVIDHKLQSFVGTFHLCMDAVETQMAFMEIFKREFYI